MATTSPVHIDHDLYQAGELADVLAGRLSYDALSARDQAFVRATWSEAVEAARAEDVGRDPWDNR